jgi:hypothetical protein
LSLQWQRQRQPLLLLLAAVVLALWQQQQQVEVCWRVRRQQQRGCLAEAG